MRPKSQFDEAHVTLRRLYDRRIGDSMTQKEFGRRYGIGSQSMVAQLLNGKKPLSIEAARKFAAAFDCTIYDICPAMGDYIKDELLPVLGKALRRAAMLAAIVLTASLLQYSKPANAQQFLPFAKTDCVLCQMLYRLLRRAVHLMRFALRTPFIFRTSSQRILRWH